MFGKKKTEEHGNTIHFTITGMHCVSCSMSIDGALEDLPGVRSATTNYAKGTTEVVYDPGTVTADAMIAAIRDAGYEAKPTT